VKEFNMHPKQKKVLYIFCFENSSGAEIVTERLIDYNKEVKAYVMCPNGDYSQRLKEKGVVVFLEKYLIPLKINENNGLKIFLFLKMLFRSVIINLKLMYFLMRYKIQIVHSTNLNASFYLLPSVLFSRLFLRRIGFIWSNHDLTYFSGKTSDKLAGLCHRYYLQTLAVSNAVKNKFPLYHDKIKVLYNGLDTSIFKFDTTKRRSFRNKRNLSTNQICIGILGNIVEHKGHLLLLEALKKLLNQKYKFKLLIVGKFVSPDSEYAQSVENTVKEFPDKMAELVGYTNDVGEIYSGLDIVINCTSAHTGEPLGTTIYEGMAYERIVLASRTGGTSEIIDDKINGFLFEAGNSTDLALKLAQIIDNYSLLEKVTINAREKVIEKFNISLMVSNYNKILGALEPIN
jgi:glycosyltransferase involved in cell wall biosynthesis